MCTGVMDHEQVTHVDLRQLSVDRKFIIVLAQRTRHIINVITRRILLAHYSNMVICAVHRRAHQVDRTCIDTDILLMRMLFIDRSRHETAIRSEHISSELGIQRNIAHAFRNQHFLIYLVHALCDDLDIVLLLIRAIRDTDSTGKIDENTYIAGIVNQYKNDFGKSRVVVIKSQLGQPITAYSGDEVYWKIPKKLPKMTKLMIDGKALYIHRANFQIIDIALLN